MGFFGAISNVFGANEAADTQKRGISRAATYQVNAAQQGIDSTNQMYQSFQDLLNPYIQGGQNAYGSLQDLLGLGQPGAQQSAISGIQNSPIFQGLQQQGENSILQNSSATGGLRGGNTQGALAQFSPQLLNQMINQLYSQYSDISSQGLGAANTLGSAGLNTAGNLSNLYNLQGSARAGREVGRSTVDTNRIGSYAQTIGHYENQMKDDVAKVIKLFSGGF